MQTAEYPAAAPAANQPSTSLDGANRFCDDVRRRVAEVVVGQDAVVERILIALFTGGHLMLQGVPGLAKTLLVNAVAKAMDLQFSRIQFTIDLLPSDIVGSEILDQKTGEFRVQKGPCSPICCWPTRSTAPPPRHKARCSKRCRNAK
jgi:MoxR-like ATPase